MGKVTKSRDEVKNLVIWAGPRQTCWDARRDPTRFPLAVMQWKVRRGPVSPEDVEWLKALTTYRRKCRGYALRLDVEPPVQLSCSCIYRGKIDDPWLVIAPKAG